MKAHALHIGLLLLVALIGCRERPLTKIIVDPASNADFGEPIYLDGKMIGHVRNLAIDSSHCYVLIDWESNLQIHGLERSSVVREGDLLVLIDSVQVPEKIRWPPNQ